MTMYVECTVEKRSYAVLANAAVPVSRVSPMRIKPVAVSEHGNDDLLELSLFT